LQNNTGFQVDPHSSWPVSCEQCFEGPGHSLSVVGPSSRNITPTRYINRRQRKIFCPKSQKI